MYWPMSFFDIIFKISTAFGGSRALMTLKAAMEGDIEKVMVTVSG